MTRLLLLIYSLKMDTELKALEEKIAQFIQLSQRLRAENLGLRQNLAAAQNENRRLSEKIELAKRKLEALIEKIPGDET